MNNIINFFKKNTKVWWILLLKISNALQMKCTVYLVLGQKWSFTICKLMTKNGSVLLISIGLRCSVRQFRPLRRHSALGIENKRSFSLFYSEDWRWIFWVFQEGKQKTNNKECGMSGLSQHKRYRHQLWCSIWPESAG